MKMWQRKSKGFPLSFRQEEMVVMTIRVRVFPRAKKPRIESGQQGRANKRLIEVLADHFGVKKRQIDIIRGETHREKIIRIREID